MLVVWKNKKWEVDMSFTVYQEMRRLVPNMMMKVTEVTSSTYKEVKYAPIGETNDYSIVRNHYALNVPLN